MVTSSPFMAGAIVENTALDIWNAVHITLTVPFTYDHRGETLEGGLADPNQSRDAIVNTVGTALLAGEGLFARGGAIVATEVAEGLSAGQFVQGVRAAEARGLGMTRWLGSGNGASGAPVLVNAQLKAINLLRPWGEAARPSRQQRSNPNPGGRAS